MKTERCARCWQEGYHGWLRKHRVKVHRQCPICPRAVIQLDRHLAWHYWREIRPLIAEKVDNAPSVADTP
jgi:hypothetical protein